MTKDAPEWRLQAAAVKRLFALQKTRSFKFTYAGDMNAARRSPREATIAKATGMMPGEPDLRVYLNGGVLKLIEYKAAGGRLSAAQKHRHPLLRALGFDVTVLKAKTEDEAATRTEELVLGWLAATPANNNTPTRTLSHVS